MGIKLTMMQLKAWTERLYHEYDHVLYQYRVKLKRPVIRIEAWTSKWGAWDPLTRTLTISSRLIQRYSWDVVIAVLKHEMAHQVVTDLYKGDHTHGAQFRQACAMLGVPDWAARAAGELPDEIPHWQGRSLSVDEERLLKRVEKLLSLASSSNENEAVLAMQRVQELYAKYNIDKIKAASAGTYVYSIINSKKQRISQVESMIFSVLSEHFFVRVIYSGLYDAGELVEHKVVELLGRRENVLMAEYVHGFLRSRLELLWKDFKKERKATAKMKSSYQVGVLVGFRDKLRAQEARATIQADDGRTYTTKEAQALMKLQDQVLDDFVGGRFPRLASRTWGRSRHDAATFRAGEADGQKIVLHKAMGSHDGNRGLLLKG